MSAAEFPIGQQVAGSEAFSFPVFLFRRKLAIPQFNWVNHTNIDSSIDYLSLFNGLLSFLNFRSTPMLGQHQQQQQQQQHNNNAASSAGIWANINFGRVAVRRIWEMPLISLTF